MKLVLKQICQVLNLALFLLALWVGIHDQDYAQATFLLALVIVNEMNLKN